MEDRLIEFETAQLAREKGFAEPCKSFWTTQYGGKNKAVIAQGVEYNNCDCDCFHEEYVEFDWNCNTPSSKQIRAPYPNKFHKSQCSAPTQTVLRKWLRENHLIQIEIIFFDNGTEEEPELSYTVSVHIPKTWHDRPEFDKANFWKYEDALEVGLQEALKLIEN